MYTAGIHAKCLQTQQLTKENVNEQYVCETGEALVNQNVTLKLFIYFFLFVIHCQVF